MAAPKGRPKIAIDWDEFKKLCSMQCTLKEISRWFQCSEDTIERRCMEEKGMIFADYFKKNATEGKISLRRSQYKAATEDGNVTMLIWLGKQYLGQTDKQEIDMNATHKLEKLSDEELDREIERLKNG